MNFCRSLEKNFACFFLKKFNKLFDLIKQFLALGYKKEMLKCQVKLKFQNSFDCFSCESLIAVFFICISRSFVSCEHLWSYALACSLLLFQFSAIYTFADTRRANTKTKKGLLDVMLFKVFRVLRQLECMRAYCVHTYTHHTFSEAWLFVLVLNIQIFVFNQIRSLIYLFTGSTLPTKSSHKYSNKRLSHLLVRLKCKQKFVN